MNLLNGYLSFPVIVGISLTLTYIVHAKMSITDLIPKPSLETSHCEIKENDSCGDDYCCVKEVLIHTADTESYKVTVGRSCKPLRSEGDLCMVKNEGYLCPCMEGLRCQAEKHFHFGHCTSL